MKKLITLTMIALFAFSFQAEAQRGNQSKNKDSELQITAIKLSDELTKFLMEKIEWKSIFKVDEKGMIIPNKEYNIRYLDKDKRIVLTTRKVGEDIPPITSDGAILFENGTLLHCWSSDNCPSCRPHRGPPAACMYQCTCFTDVYILHGDVVEFETPQGNYRGDYLR